MTVLGFAAEWYDPIAREITNLFLKFFLEDGTIELLKNGIKQSTFLKRIHYPQVTIQDMFIGSSLSVFNRVIILTDYANSATRDYLMSREVHFMCVVKADMLNKLNRVLDVVGQHRLSIGRARTVSQSLPEIGADVRDIVFEFVGIQGQNGEDFIGDIDRSGVGANVSVAPFQDISVRKLYTIIEYFNIGFRLLMSVNEILLLLTGNYGSVWRCFFRSHQRDTLFVEASHFA